MGDGESSETATRFDPRSGLAREEIRAQLDRILASPEFHATDKMRDFLRFAVEEKLGGRAYRLKGKTIAVDVFGRGDDFDAANDPIVRIQAGRLRRALERYYLVAGGRDPILIDIPKGGYVPQFASLAAPPDASGAPSASSEVCSDRFADGPSVALMPFDNLTGDAGQLPLTVGLTEELLTELTRFQDVAVIACQSARRPSGLPSDPVELARSLGARFVLRGSVRRDAHTVKVSSQLSDATDGRQVWANAYSHPPTASGLIATQEQIAHSVVAAIAAEYGIIARRLSAESAKKAPAELTTYETMLRYYAHQITPDPESSEACFAALHRAVEREPEYAPAWSALATLYCQMYTMDVPGFDRPLETGLEHARQAVTLAPQAQLCHLIMAYASYLAEDGECFREEAETALALNPNSPYTVGAIGYFHALRGDVDLALPLMDRAIAANPCHPAWFRAVYVIDHLLRSDYDAALAETRKHLPFISFWDDVLQAAILGKLGRIGEADPHVDRLRRTKPDFGDRARELFGRALKFEPLIDDLVDGLRAAGMRVEDRGRSPWPVVSQAGDG